MAGVSNHYDFMNSLLTMIQGLSLTGSPSVDIAETAVYQDGKKALPYITISPYGPEQVRDSTNVRDEVGYGVLIAIIAQPDTNDLERRLGWRQSIRRKCKNNAFPALSTNFQIEVEPGNVVEPEFFRSRNGFASGFVVRGWFQELRT